MKTPTPFIVALILGSFLLASCQSNTTTDVAPTPSPAAKVKPLPSWTKLVGQKATRANSRQVKFTTKMIEITREPGSEDLPSGLSQKKLSSRAYQSYVRKISQKKGADIMSSPSVVSYEGETAKVGITREFAYPNPRQPSQSMTEETGVTQFFRARSYDGGKTYRLNILAQVKEFTGFQELPSGAEQPVFKTRQIGESVTIANGETILFSGLVTDEEQQIEDRIPFLGAIPLVGRAFSQTKTHTFKSELILAVTADRVR